MEEVDRPAACCMNLYFLIELSLEAASQIKGTHGKAMMREERGGGGRENRERAAVLESHIDLSLSFIHTQLLVPAAIAGWLYRLPFFRGPVDGNSAAGGA